MFKTLASLCFFFAIVAFSGCGPDSGSGTLNVLATDSPFPFSTVASATVTLTKIEARLNDGTGDSFITLSEASQTIDLVQLRNGIAADLVSLDVPTGDYDQVRLFVSGGIVVMTDGRTYDLKVPSGSETGIKVNLTPAIHVTGQLSSDLLLDFDLAKSFVPQGGGHTIDGISGFHFNPVVRASNLTTAGTLSGTTYDDLGTPGVLSDDETLDSAVIAVSQNGQEVAEAISDADGHYALIGLPAGSYDVAVSRPGFVSVALSTAIVAGNVTRLDVALAASATTGTAAAGGETLDDSLKGAPEHVPHVQLQKGYSRPSGTSNPNLTYHGGRVLHATKSMAIFWGTEWNSATFAGDTITGIDQLFTAMNNSRYASTADEYYDVINSVTTSVVPSSAYLGHVLDTTAAPTKALSTSNAVAEACKIVANNPDSDAVYFIYTSTGAGHVNYCAWHSWGTCSNGKQIQVAYMPNITGIAGCDPQDTTTTHSQGLAALANVTSHEFLEAVTDPRGTGWVDSSGNENADKCAWSFPNTAGGLSTLADGSQWKIQMEWSNAAYTAGTGQLNRSGQPGCIF
ncbi:MAG: DUF4382 domain-containing protein [Deltaproteobacteria bacterium]|nr:DUF4382 domain-containing protein [Deltaproteobacteria bacterium]